MNRKKLFKQICSMVLALMLVVSVTVATASTAYNKEVSAEIRCTLKSGGVCCVATRD